MTVKYKNSSVSNKPEFILNENCVNNKKKKWKLNINYIQTTRGHWKEKKEKIVTKNIIQFKGKFIIIIIITFN